MLKKRSIVKHVKNTTINIDDIFCVQLINLLFAISQQIVDTLSCQYLTLISFFFFFFELWPLRWLRWLRICLQCRRHGFNPWVGKIPGGGNGNPLQYSCLENPMARGAWRIMSRRVAKSRTRLKQLSMHA